MKILTNFRFAKMAGIAQALSSFIDFVDLEANNDTEIVGVDVWGTGSPESRLREGSFSLISRVVDMPNIIDAVKSSTSIAELEQRYRAVIDAYREAIEAENPDVILINGTYFLPWCLLRASRKFAIPVVVHYHGSITKETEHYKQPQIRELFHQMERQFDNHSNFYIFPSQLIKTVVENEVFRHPIKKSAILANSVPLHFFDSKPRTKNNRIGIIGRWTRIKNPQFITRLAKYNAKHGNKFSLHIVSDLKKDTAQYKELKNLAVFTRPMDNLQLSAFYASMSVVISPSHFETYGNVAKEALASGVPALVNSQMGVAETFHDLGLDDWITDFKSVRSVYAKIQEISGKEVPVSSRIRLQQRYSSQYIHGKMLKLIKSA